MKNPVVIRIGREENEKIKKRKKKNIRVVVSHIVIITVVVQVK